MDLLVEIDGICDVLGRLLFRLHLGTLTALDGFCPRAEARVSCLATGMVESTSELEFFRTKAR